MNKNKTQNRYNEYQVPVKHFNNHLYDVLMSIIVIEWQFLSADDEVVGNRIWVEIHNWVLEFQCVLSICLSKNNYVY